LQGSEAYKQERKEKQSHFFLFWLDKIGFSLSRHKPKNQKRGGEICLTKKAIGRTKAVLLTEIKCSIKASQIIFSIAPANKPKAKKKPPSKA